MNEHPQVPWVTTYFGRKRSDGNYGSADDGIWLSLPLGADQQTIEDATEQAERMLAASKPVVLDKVKPSA